MQEESREKLSILDLVSNAILAWSTPRSMSAAESKEVDLNGNNESTGNRFHLNTKNEEN